MRRAEAGSIDDGVFALVVRRAEKRRELVAVRLRMGCEIMRIPSAFARPDLEQTEMISSARSLPQDLIFGHARVFDGPFAERLHDFEQLGYCGRGDVEMA